MPEIKSFPNNQDVYVGAEWVMKWLHGRTSGVFGADENLATFVMPDSMSIEVSDGVGWLSNDKSDGIVFWNDYEQTNGSKLRLTHDVADGVLDRIDRIVVTWETTNYVALPEISILRGTASSSPVPPALTNNNIQRQISLAKVSIPAGTVSLSPTMLTDERLDPSVCGLVTESISVDTSVVNAQFKELLELVKKNLKQITDEQILDKSITVSKLAEETVAYIDSKASSWNLLDNSDFTHFVAQAGVGGKHGTTAYAGDRWILDSGTVIGTANENGDGYSSITLNGTIRQKVANPPDVGTPAFNMVSGTATISYANGEVVITSAGGVIKNAALYEGEYTVDKLPAYQPNGYAAELLECQRYYYRFQALVGTGATAAQRVFLPLPVTMRVIPTIEYELNSGTNPNFVVMQSANAVDIKAENNSYSHLIIKLSADL